MTTLYRLDIDLTVDHVQLNYLVADLLRPHTSDISAHTLINVGPGGDNPNLKVWSWNRDTLIKILADAYHIRNDVDLEEAVELHIDVADNHEKLDLLRARAERLVEELKSEHGYTDEQIKAIIS